MIDVNGGALLHREQTQHTGHRGAQHDRS